MSLLLLLRPSVAEQTTPPPTTPPPITPAQRFASAGLSRVIHPFIPAKTSDDDLVAILITL